MKIGIVFGANSFEHEISIVSAISMKKVLKSEIVYIFCDINREFYLIPTDKINSKRFSSGEYKKDKKIELKKDGFFLKTFTGLKKVEYDVVLNLVHGADGEDGKLASLFDFFNIKYIGPSIEASVLSFNKLYTKMYAKEIGIKTLKYEVLNKSDERKVSFEFPFIIKPSRLGSSLGISIVKSQEELDYALDVAFELDTQVIVEPFIEGIQEYNLAGGYTKEGFQFSIIEQPQKEEYLDFDKKYLDFSRTKRVNEANIDEPLNQKMKENFKRLYAELFQGAIIRCDFFVIENEVYINEINPIPGSMANYLFDDFETLLIDMSENLKAKQRISCEYKYINSIQSAKGK